MIIGKVHSVPSFDAPSFTVPAGFTVSPVGGSIQPGFTPVPGVAPPLSVADVDRIARRIATILKESLP